MTYEEMIQQIDTDLGRLTEVRELVSQMANPDPQAPPGPPSAACVAVRAALALQRPLVAGETAVLERLEELEAQLCPV